MIKQDREFCMQIGNQYVPINDILNSLDIIKNLTTNLQELNATLKSIDEKLHYIH